MIPYVLVMLTLGDYIMPLPLWTYVGPRLKSEFHERCDKFKPLWVDDKWCS